ncbi:MAG: bifunctional metallophosphatase/5'-nucleotidase [Leucobacter sp.]
MRKTIRALGAAAAGAALVLSSSIAAVADEPGFTGTVSVVHFNDVHGYLSESSTTIGYPKIAAFIDQQRAENPNTVVLDAGDVIAGNPTASLDQGFSFAAILNTMGIDAMTAGNAEFSFGSAPLIKFRDALDYPMLAPNMVERTTHEPMGPGHTVIDLPNGMHVGVFGVTTPASAGMGTTDYVYTDAVAAAQTQVDELEAEGVDLIIGLTHLGEIDPKGNVLDVADQVPGIDLLVDGHTHTVYETGTTRNGVKIVQAGSYGEKVGTVDLAFEDGEFVGSTARLHHRADFDAVTPKVETQAELDSFLDRLAAFFDHTVGSSDVVLEGTRNVVRTQETNLGNMFTDAIREKSGADLVLYPAGNIGGPVGPGQITRSDVYTMARLNVEVVVVQMTGAQIMDFLADASNTYPGPSGYFLQISGGSYRLDPSTKTDTAPATVHSVKVAGVPLNPKKSYAVAVETGATVSPGVSEGTVISSVGFAAPLLEDYIASHSPVAPVAEGRIAEAKVPVTKPVVQKKVQPKLTVKLSTKKPKANKTRVVTTVKLTASGVKSTARTGKVVVKVGKKTVKTVTLTSSKKGVVKFKLPKFTKKGKAKLTVSYLGNKQLKTAKRTVNIRVR